MQKIEKTRLYAVLVAIPSADHSALIVFIKQNSRKADVHLIFLGFLLDAIAQKQVLTRTEVWIKLYAAEPYNDVKLRLLCSDLLHSVEAFVLQESTDTQMWERDRRLCAYFIKHSAAKLANFYHTAMLVEKKKFKHRDLTFFYHSLLENETNLQLQDLLDTPTFDLIQIDLDLDKTFVLAKLKNSTRNFWATVVGQKSTNDLFLTEIIRIIPETPHLYNERIINLYYHLYLLFIENKLDVFDKIKTELANLNYINKHEASDIYLMIENFLALNIQNQKFTYYDLLAWYEQSDAQDMLYTSSGTILSARLQSILNTYMLTKQYEKGLAFLNKKRERIAHAERETTYNLNLGHIYFYLGRYTDVPNLVLPITPDFPVQYIMAQRILLKTYYVQHQESVLENALTTFQHYLYTSKRIIAPHNKEGNLNFIKTLRYIAQARDLRNRPSRNTILAKAEKRIAQSGFISDKIWLNDQIADLKK
jgi:hypothetical protein